MPTRPRRVGTSKLGALLADCALFDFVPPEHVTAFIRSGRVRRVRHGDVLFSQGHVSTRVYVLLEGAGMLVRTAPKGHRVVLALLRPGDVFGFVDIFGRSDQTYTAEIAEDGRVLSWSRERMRRMIDQHPIMVTNALRMMARRVQAYWVRIEDLATAPVARRVARTLLRLTNGTTRKLSLLHRDLAEFVGTTPPTLSRILRRWQRHGLVSGGRATLQLRDPDRLRAIAVDP